MLIKLPAEMVSYPGPVYKGVTLLYPMAVFECCGLGVVINKALVVQLISVYQKDTDQ